MKIASHRKDHSHSESIGLCDRNQVPAGATIYRADASSLMELFSLTMMKVALELVAADAKYDDLAATFFQHFVFIADALNHVRSLPEAYADPWVEQDGFYYDVIRSAVRSFHPLEVRSLQGLMPIFAVETISMNALERQEGKDFRERLDWFIGKHPKLIQQVSPMKETERLAARTVDYLISEAEVISRSNQRHLARPPIRRHLSPPGTHGRRPAIRTTQSDVASAASFCQA